MRSLMTVSRIACFLVVLAVVAACAPVVRTHGMHLDEEDLQLVIPGESSRSEVADILGTPSFISNFDENVWFYVGETTHTTAFLSPELIERDVYVVTFGEDGYVASMDYLDETNAEDVEVVDRKTPTRGQPYTLAEQFMGSLFGGRLVNRE